MNLREQIFERIRENESVNISVQPELLVTNEQSW